MFSGSESDDGTMREETPVNRKSLNKRQSKFTSGGSGLKSMMSKKLQSITSNGTFNVGGPAEINDNEDLKS